MFNILNLSKQNGLGMIEVLVSVVILSIGILAVTKLQTVSISNNAENKARSEALLLVKSRMENLRNYSGDISDEDQFMVSYAATDGYVNSNTIAGNNSQFIRTEKFEDSGLNKSVSVKVAWIDSLGTTQEVLLESEVSWQNPRSSADYVAERSAPLIESATGRARLGEGVLPENAETTLNDDGTRIYDAGDGDLRLVVGSDIVLTLEDACVSGQCLGFVKISGRVYIDQATQKNLSPSDVFVKASDAAFCQRFWSDSNALTQTVKVNTDSTIFTTNEDYQYFDYTCYIGGGWHGNIGILLASGIAQTDKVCMGDPTSNNAWEEPEISIRRSYRGMLSKVVDGQSETFVDTEGFEKIKYYTQGIADQTVLPDPTTEDAGHDFIISKMATTDTTGDKCISNGVMVRTDSQSDSVVGGLFKGVPTDFVCFNPNYVDSFDTDIFAAEGHCPYDPTDPPVTAHYITGSISVLADSSASLIVNAIEINTSDGEGNCELDEFTAGATTFDADYSCLVFDWGNGWGGYLRAAGDLDQISCSPQKLELSDVFSNKYQQDFSCLLGNIVVVTGNVTGGAKNKQITSATISDTDGICVVAADGLSYECATSIFATDTWDGTVTITSNANAMCDVANFVGSTGIANFSAVDPGTYDIDIQLEANNNKCP